MIVASYTTRESPMAATRTSEIAYQEEEANRTMLTPAPNVPMVSSLHLFEKSLKLANTAIPISAPAPPAAERYPSPVGPTLRTVLAITGSMMM